MIKESDIWKCLHIELIVAHTFYLCNHIQLNSQSENSIQKPVEPV